MSRLPIEAGDLDNWGAILNDFLLQSLKADGTLRDELITAAKINGADAVAIRALLDIADTGSITALIDDLSGVTDAATARANLSIYSQAEVASAIAAAVADYLLKSGGTMTGKIVLDGAPTADLHAATKKYVDDITTSRYQIFDSSGTFTVPAEVTKLFVTGCGGGGGGGAAGGAQAEGGGGGGAGRGGIDIVVTVTPEAEHAVTIGGGGAGGAAGGNGSAGSDTILASLITFDGGGGGTGQPAGSGAYSIGVCGGNGGNASTKGSDSLYYEGGAGGPGGASGGSGGGGASLFGDGGDYGAVNGNSGDRGSGGSGAGGTSGSGGAGSDGKLIIRW